MKKLTALLLALLLVLGGLAALAEAEPTGNEELELVDELDQIDASGLPELSSPTPQRA